MNINQNQKTALIIGTVGLIGLGRLGYYIYQEFKGYRQQYQKAQSVHFENKNIDFNSLKKNNFTKDVIIEEVMALNVKEDTLRLRNREVPIIPTLNDLLIDEMIEHVVGGEFDIQYQKQKIKCDIKDTSVSIHLLESKAEEVSVFGRTQPVVKKVDQLLKKNVTLAIYGAISFHKNSGKWVIEPYFMGKSATQILNYIDSRRLAYEVIGVLLGIAGAIVLGTFIIGPISSWWNRQNHKYRQIRRDQFSHFKNMRHLEANPADKLKCSECDANSAEIAFECGHLVVCSECCEKMKEDRNTNCPVCNKKSKKFLKLYLV